MLVENKRTLTVKYLWQFAAVIIILMGVFRFIVLSTVLLEHLQLISEIASLSLFLSLSSTIITIGSILISLTAGFVAWYYPEVFLLTRSQVNYLYNLYDISSQHETQKLLDTISSEEIIKYLTEIKQNYRYSKYDDK